MLSSNQILAGLGLVVVLAMASQLLAGRLRLPAIVLLLPVGFAAGAVTDTVHPDKLLGDVFEPLVSIGVGIILFEAGLRLNMRGLEASVRRVVVRLISLGVLLTLVGLTVAAKLIVGLNWGVALVLGAILVVSGPTVVLPLLAFVRPADRVREALKWEGTLIDPIGALLGVVAFRAVQAGLGTGGAFKPGGLFVSLAVGLAVGLLAAGLLWILLRRLQRSRPREVVLASLLVAVGALVGADLIRQDSGFVATVVAGMVMANQRRIDVSRVLEFQGAVVTIVIGILFVLISASVTPSEVRDELAGGLGLVAVAVVLIRPLVVVLATIRSSLSGRERAFVAWMAPRGIVAAATASSFGLELGQQGVAGAEKILPLAFIVIFATVVLYGLTAEPVARLLGVAGAGAPVILLVGGQAWAREIALALERAGFEVRLWTGDPREQQAARDAGLDAGKARLGVDVETREAELEEVSIALLLTGGDDFNALAAYELRSELGRDRVYRLAPAAETLDLVPEYAEGGVLFGDDLTYAELTRRFDAGATLVELDGARAQSVSAGGPVPLFVRRADGTLRVVAADEEASVGEGETALCLSPPTPATVTPA